MAVLSPASINNRIELEQAIKAGEIFNQQSFNKANLTGAELGGGLFTDCSFTECNFDAAQLI